MFWCIVIILFTTDLMVNSNSSPHFFVCLFILYCCNYWTTVFDISPPSCVYNVLDCYTHTYYIYALYCTPYSSCLFSSDVFNAFLQSRILLKHVFDFLVTKSLWVRLYNNFLLFSHFYFHTLCNFSYFITHFLMCIALLFCYCIFFWFVNFPRLLIQLLV